MASFSSNKISSAQKVIERFADPLDCLTAHLLYESAEVLADIKPANLISIVNRRRPCGRNLYNLWNEMHKSVSARLPGLEFITLQQKDRSILLLCFNRTHLETSLSHQGVRALLKKAGYNENATVNELLSELAGRVRERSGFPHEIGLFIGYPAKDVAAFMGYVRLPFRCQALWKIYGRPVESLRLAENFRNCRKKMGKLLENISSLDSSGEKELEAFFCQTNDIRNQFLVETV